MMQVLAHIPWENGQEWIDELCRQASAHRVHVWPDHPGLDQIEAAVVWAPSTDFFEGMTGLRAVMVPGAGVDQLLKSRDTLPKVPIVRLADPLMASRMADYVLAMVLDHQRLFRRYREQQGQAVWLRHFHKDPGDIHVGILGIGLLGTSVARQLRAVGYRVSGWSRRVKNMDGIETFSGESGFERLVKSSDVLVCLLPLTDGTRGILNADVFEAMPEGGLVINVARGGHLVVADLLAALDAGKLSGAVLDVFEDEPLAPESPIWRHPSITVTPHVASFSNPVTGIRQIVQALDRIDAGGLPENLVDLEAGY